MNQNPRDSTTQQAASTPKHSDRGAGASRPSQSEGHAQTAVAASGASEGRREPKSACAECAVLRAEVEELRTSRDDAVFALAKERELLQALRSKYATAERFVRKAQEPPMRYIVVDKLNRAFKERFEILHVGAKRMIAFFVGSTKSQTGRDSK